MSAVPRPLFLKTLTSAERISGRTTGMGTGLLISGRGRQGLYTMTRPRFRGAGADPRDLPFTDRALHRSADMDGPGSPPAEENMDSAAVRHRPRGGTLVPSYARTTTEGGHPDRPYERTPGTPPHGKVPSPVKFAHRGAASSLKGSTSSWSIEQQSISTSGHGRNCRAERFPRPGGDPRGSGIGR